MRQRPLQTAGHGLAQVGLGQPGRRGVDGRQPIRQRPPSGRENRVHHFLAPQTCVQLTPHAHTLAHRQCLLVAWVEHQKAQHTAIGPIINRDPELPAWPLADLLRQHGGLKLHRLPVVGSCQRNQLCVVFIAKRHVQGQVPIGLQSHFVHGAHSRRQCWARHRSGRRAAACHANRGNSRLTRGGDHAALFLRHDTCHDRQQNVTASSAVTRHWADSPLH
jgi:hypothetical protein